MTAVPQFSILAEATERCFATGSRNLCACDSEAASSAGGYIPGLLVFIKGWSHQVLQNLFSLALLRR